MSTLEDLLYARLAGDSTLTALLATITTASGPAPAIFVEQSPNDTAREWINAQLPRIVLTVSRSVDPARGSEAMLIVDVYASTLDIPAISDRVRVLLEAVYWHPTGEPPLATRLSSIASAPQLAELSGAEDAIEHMYNVLVFPNAPSIDPNVASAIYTWATAKFSTGVQANPSTWDSDASAPALYASLRSKTLVRRWMNARPPKFEWQGELRVHVMHASAQTRQEWTQRVVDQLALNPDIPLSNSGILRVEKPTMDMWLDPLRFGQVSAQVSFLTAAPASGVDRIQRVIITGDTPLEVPHA